MFSITKYLFERSIWPRLVLCGVREVMDNVVLEINTFNWSQRSFDFVQLENRIFIWRFAYHFTATAER